jgi:hypothetical protein
MSNWILQAARRQSGKQLALALIVLAIVVMMMLVNMDYIREYFRGPHTITANDLSPTSSKTQGWLTLKADKIHPTGIQEITVRKKRGVERGRSVSAVYFIAEVGNQFVLVKGMDGQTTALQGTFEPMNGELAAQVFKEPQMQAMRSQFYPLVMNTHDYDNEASTWLPVGGIVALGALIWGLMGLKRYRNPESHPGVKPFVEAGTLKAAGASIQRSMTGKSTFKLGKTFVTPEYVITQGWTKLDIKPMEQLLWAYKQVTQQKLYYIIPAGKTYAASLNFEKGTVLLSGKQDKVDEVLEYVAARAPWAAFGHDDDIAQVYKKQRASLVDYVKRRKEDYLKQQQGAAMNTAAEPARAAAATTASEPSMGAVSQDLPPLEYKS